jgi:hypothetical protein
MKGAARTNLKDKDTLTTDLAFSFSVLNSNPRNMNTPLSSLPPLSLPL